MKKALMCLVSVFVVLAAVGGGLYAKEEGGKASPDKVVAKVNGVAIRLSDLAVPPEPPMPPDMEGMPADVPEKKVPESQRLKPLIDKAIETELLCQAATKAGFDKDESYLNAVELQKKQTAWYEKMMLATSFEAQDKELSAARDIGNVSDKEIAKYIKENEEFFGNMEEKRSVSIAKARVANEKFAGKYAPWLKDIARKIPVEINQKKVPNDALSELLDLANPPKPGDTQRSSPRKFWKVLCDAAGVKPPADTVDPATPPDPAAEQAAAKALGNVSLKIGEAEVSIADAYPLSEILAMGLPPAEMVVYELFTFVKTYIVAEAAKAAGHTYSEDMMADPMMAGDPAMMGFAGPHGAMMAPSGYGTLKNPAKGLLASMFLRKQEFNDLSKVELSDEEVDAYYKKYGSRYARLEKRPGGKERVRRIIKSVAQQEKISQAREKYIEGLKSKAKVKVMN